MSTALKVPRLPSAADMERTMRERLPGHIVYNPGGEWLKLQVHGLDYWAPPDRNGAWELHPITGRSVKCDGRLEVKSRYLTQKDSSGKIITGQDSSSIVQYMVGIEAYGQMGLVWLPGLSPEEDADLIERSKNQFAIYQRTKDEDIVSRRIEFKKNWEKGPHKGQTCPPPTRMEVDAMDRLQALQRKADWRYTCDVADCDTGYASNDWERFASHMVAAHKISPKRENYEAEVSGLSPEPPQRPEPEPEPAKSAIEEAAVLMVARMDKAAETKAAKEEDETEEEEEDTPRPRRRKK